MGKRVRILQTGRTFVSLHGFCSKNDNGKLSKWEKTRLFLTFALFWGLGAGTTMHLIHGLINSINMPAHRIVEDISVSLSTVTVFLFLVSFISKHTEVNQLIKHLENYKFGLHINVTKKNTHLNSMNAIFYFYVILGNVLCAIFEKLNKNKCEQENTRYGLGDVCGLFRRVYVPFEIDDSPVYEIFYVYQLVSAYCLYVPASSIIFFVYGTIQHLIYHIENLKVMIGGICTNKNSGEQEKSLLKCIEYQKHIMGLLDKANESYGYIMSVFKFFGSLMISVIAYELLLDTSAAITIYLGGWITTTFLVNYAGQRLLDQSESVALAFYECKWYESSVNFRRNLRFAIMRSQKPLLIKSAFYGIMSSNTFLMVIRAAYSYFSLFVNKHQE